MLLVSLTRELPSVSSCRGSDWKPLSRLARSTAKSHKALSRTSTSVLVQCSCRQSSYSTNRGTRTRAFLSKSRATQYQSCTMCCLDRAGKLRDFAALQMQFLSRFFPYLVLTVRCAPSRPFCHCTSYSTLTVLSFSGIFKMRGVASCKAPASREWRHNAIRALL